MGPKHLDQHGGTHFETEPDVLERKKSLVNGQNIGHKKERNLGTVKGQCPRIVWPYRHSNCPTTNTNIVPETLDFLLYHYLKVCMHSSWTVPLLDGDWNNKLQVDWPFNSQWFQDSSFFCLNSTKQQEDHDTNSLEDETNMAPFQFNVFKRHSTWCFMLKPLRFWEAPSLQPQILRVSSSRATPGLGKMINHKNQVLQYP